MKLGDHRLFDQLADLTKPVTETRYVFSSGSGSYGGAPDGVDRAPVTLLERQTLGPFDVSTLSTTDSGALGDWLEKNGYHMPPGLSNALKPYVQEGWYYIAARLTPGKGSELMGTLDPIRVTFKSDRLIYPMRASSIAKDSIGVQLYVLAPHRVEGNELMYNVAALYGPMARPDDVITYAGWIEPASLDKDSSLRSLVDNKLFLTKLDFVVDDPSKITGDFAFHYTDNDYTYYPVDVDYVYISPWIIVAGVILILLLGVAAFLIARRLIKRKRPHLR